jgi:hypothetical protein
MKSHIDRLLIASLNPYANYAEKQMLKAGDLGQCAAQVVKRRRRTVSRFRLVFIALICMPTIVQAIAAWFSSSR